MLKKKVLHAPKLKQNQNKTLKIPLKSWQVQSIELKVSTNCRKQVKLLAFSASYLNQVSLLVDFSCYLNQMSLFAASTCYVNQVLLLSVFCSYSTH